MLCETFFFSTVLPKPTGSTYINYFILQNGSDTSDCGGSVESACASLPHVLSLYYANPPTMGLMIKTDKSLLIDSKLMVSKFVRKVEQSSEPFEHDKTFHLLFQRKCEAFRSSKFGFISLEPKKYIDINVTDAHFKQSYWSATGINMFFSYCQIQSLGMFLNGTYFGPQLHLHIMNCTIGSQIVIQNMKATLRNCSLLMEKQPPFEPVLAALNSTVILKYSVIDKFRGCFLHAIQSISYLFDVKVVNCVSSYSLLYFKESFLSIKTCTFLANENSLVDIRNHSVGFYQ